MKHLILLVVLSLILITISCNSKNETPNNDTIYSLDSIVFTAIGDVPYNEGQRTGLIELIKAHNAKAKSEFVVHVGDIKAGSDPCTEPFYKYVNEILKEFKIPTFMILGDNEYNDCEDPVAAFELWNKYFLNFQKNWTFDYTVTSQENRPENFVWSQNKVMFMGLNLVGSSVHDKAEWETRLIDNGKFLEDYVNSNADNLEALVIFGQANMVELGPVKFKPFTDILKSVATKFEKPILYVQGDGHFWLLNRPYDEKNILRVQVEGGATAVQITVNPNLKEPFSFDREFLD